MGLAIDIPIVYPYKTPLEHGNSGLWRLLCIIAKSMGPLRGNNGGNQTSDSGESTIKEGDRQFGALAGDRRADFVC